MVKSAAPSTQAAASSSTPAVPAVPTNIAAGTAHNPLSDLTGARYAGQVNLPSRSLFGADGGVGHFRHLPAPDLNPYLHPLPLLLRTVANTRYRQMGAMPNEDAVAEMMSDPATAQMMNEALSDPRTIDMLIQNDPTLRAMGPQARELLSSPLFRQLMTDPNLMRQAASFGRGMRGGAGSSFAAPGDVPTVPGSGGAAQSPAAGDAAANPFAALMGGGGGMGAGGMPSPEMMRQVMQMMGGGAGSPGAAGGLGGLGALFGNPSARTPAAPGATPADPTSPQNTAANSGESASGNADAGANPFAALFGAAPGQPANPFLGGLPPPTPEQMQQAMAMFQQLGAGGAGAEGAQLPPFLGGFGGAGGAPPAPADTRPPEEQYADQLRQLNDMGFFDFEENVRALRRAGGSVQGAINQLLG